MTTFYSAANMFDELLGDIKYSPDSNAGKLYPFFLRVGCIKRRPPRHKYFDYLIDMGRGFIDDVMAENPIESENLTFVFPERWLGVAEKQAFMDSLSKNPNASKFKQVDVITSEPMIIGSCYAEQIRILTWPEDSGVYDCSALPT